MLAAMPDIEAMELVDRFFEVGAEVVGTPHPIGIFLAGCRECLGEWELQASQWSHPSSGRGREPIALDQTVCPHGQTPASGESELTREPPVAPPDQTGRANGEPDAQK